jgi:diguanylate cyclase (GGDEF)-like protein
MTSTISPWVWALVPGCAAAAAATVTTGLPGWTTLGVITAGLLTGERATANRRHRRELAAAIRLAGTDELTGLANRRALLSALNDALTGAGPVGLVVVDLDEFKSVNDTHGHVVGDHVLQVVAVRLRESMSQSCLVARLGGDEFAVLAPASDRPALAALATRAQAALARPLPVAAGRHVLVGASIGTAVRAESGCTATDLLRQADAAMYQAKGPAAAQPPPCPPADPDPHDPPGHARAAVESLPALSHEAAHGGGLLCPSQLHAVVSYLWLLTNHLTGTLVQAGRWLEEQHAAGQVRQDAGPDASPAVRDSLDDLTAAITANHRTTSAVGAARRRTIGLTGHPFGHGLR